MQDSEQGWRVCSAVTETNGPFHEPRSSGRESAHYSPTGKVRADSRRAATVHGPDARHKAVAAFHEPRSSGRESAHYSPTGKVRADSRRAATVHGPDARQKAVAAFHEPRVERD